MKNDSNRPSGVVRIIALLDAVTLAGGHLRYRDAERALAPISPNTVARLLRELVAARVLERHKNGYRLGDRPAFWAVSVPLEKDLRLMARPILIRLSARLGLTACLVARMDQHMTIVDRIVAPHGPTLMPPGRFRPVNAVNIGGPFFLPAADLMDSVRWSAALGKTYGRAARELIRRQIATGLDRGLVDDGGLIYPDLRRLVAPIRRNGEIMACLGLAGSPALLADTALRRRASRLLGEAAKQLSSGPDEG